MAQLIRDAVRGSIRTRGFGSLPPEPDGRGKYDRAAKGLMNSQTLKQRSRRERQREHTRRWRERQKARPSPQHPGPLPQYSVQHDGYVLSKSGGDTHEVGYISSDGYFVPSGYAKEADVFLAFLLEQNLRREAFPEQVRRWLDRCEYEYPNVVTMHREFLEDQTNALEGTDGGLR